MTSETSVPPSVSWAQRTNNVFVIFNVECEKPDIKIENKSLYFKGIGMPENKLYEVTIPLYAEVNPEASSQVNKERFIELNLAKEKTNEPFWPTLTSDKIKRHWLKIDFNRWQDEDESSEELDEMSDMFSSKVGGFGDETEDLSSSEGEDDLPDLE